MKGMICHPRGACRALAVACSQFSHAAAIVGHPDEGMVNPIDSCVRYCVEYPINLIPSGFPRKIRPAAFLVLAFPKLARSMRMALRVVQASARICF